MTFYHASNTANIKTLEPRVSNHNTPLIYFSDKRENVLVYLSNAVEKLCKEEKIDPYDGIDIQIPDAYNELLEAERTGKIVIARYKDFISSESRKELLHKTIVEQYNSSEDHPEYRFFLKKKFSDILKN